MSKRKIMIVEDEAIPALVLKQMLEGWGYEVCPVITTGKEAVENVKTERPDLIFMDITLRGEMNGIEAALAIKASFGTPSIFITGYTDEKIIKKTEESGSPACFVKPLNYDKLKMTLDQILPIK